MNKQEFKKIVINLLKDNEENFEMTETSFDEGYTKGMHDGILDLANKLGVTKEELGEEYYN